MIRSCFKEIEILSLRDFPQYKAPEEVGSSFSEIAEQKALDAAKATGLYTLGDDSGLIVPALGGEPGLFSKRYAGDGATDKDNRNKLTLKLKTLREEERDAYFECALTLATPDGIVKTSRGTCEGKLVIEPRGRSGFGYDPLFMKHDYNRTFAELEEDIKNRISHRRKAFDKLVPYLEIELTKLESLR